MQTMRLVLRNTIVNECACFVLCFAIGKRDCAFAIVFCDSKRMCGFYFCKCHFFDSCDWAYCCKYVLLREQTKLKKTSIYTHIHTYIYIYIYTHIYIYSCRVENGCSPNWPKTEWGNNHDISYGISYVINYIYFIFVL